MRTLNPQPAAHSVHTLGFIVAMPGMMSSSGTKRMIWCSGVAAARQRGAGAGNGGQLDERSTIHHSKPSNSECKMQNADIDLLGQEDAFLADRF